MLHFCEWPNNSATSKNSPHVITHRLVGELMKMHPIDRMGVIAELPRELDAALKKREASQ